MEIEGTGINLFGGSAVLSIGALVAAFIFIPGFGVVILWVIGRLRKSTVQVMNGVEGFVTEHPDAGNDLKEWLSSQMDSGPKALIKSWRTKYIDRSNIEEVLKKKAEAHQTSAQ